jgi:hypothetical protein
VFDKLLRDLGMERKTRCPSHTHRLENFNQSAQLKQVHIYDAPTHVVERDLGSVNNSAIVVVIWIELIANRAWIDTSQRKIVEVLANKKKGKLQTGDHVQPYRQRVKTPVKQGCHDP